VRLPSKNWNWREQKGAHPKPFLPLEGGDTTFEKKMGKRF
jgi:hypothetical protein